ncbi:hypothetical protein [Lacticaseibacillus salsurivasis]|uniref:hypothetical protein n=1 Tax=Lacticaseibacillus salsurivasis TaxID=3081441 RepID=UPI0030C77AA9
MGRAKRKRKNAMKRRQEQGDWVTVSLAPGQKPTTENLAAALEPILEERYSTMFQDALDKRAAEAEVAHSEVQDEASKTAPAPDLADDPDYAPLLDLDETDDDEEVPDDCHEDGESLGDDEDTDAWLEDEKLAYGDDWDGLGNEDDDD